MTDRAAVDACLQHPRVALVGLSHDPGSFSRSIDAELRAAGYEVVPVNPSVDAIDGRPCFPSVAAIDEPVDWVLVMTPARTAASVVDDAHAAGVTRVWLHRGAGAGAVSPEAIARARTHGMTLVDGQCPLMFVGKDGEPPAWIHRAHGFFKKLGGTYPR